jgi:hypothetical protein
VISHDYWRPGFGGSGTAVGQPVTIDGVHFTVIGVAPAGFSGEAPSEAPDVWTSMARRRRPFDSAIASYRYRGATEGG